MISICFNSIAAFTLFLRSLAIAVLDGGFGGSNCCCAVSRGSDILDAAIALLESTGILDSPASSPLVFIDLSGNDCSPASFGTTYFADKNKSVYFEGYLKLRKKAMEIIQDVTLNG